MGADYVDAIDGVRVAGACEGGLLDRCGFGTGVPEENLTRVTTAHDEIRVKGRELGRQDIGLCVEDKLGAVVKVHVPYLHQSIRIVWCSRILGVGCQEEFGELGRECKV